MLSPSPKTARAHQILVAFGIWVVAIGGLGFVLGFSGGPAVRRTLVADGASLGAVCAAIHLGVRAVIRRNRDAAE